MGLDPFTSTAIAEVAADKTGNDPTIPAAITAGPYGTSANQAYDGNMSGAAQSGLAATGAVAAGGIGGAQAGAAGAGGAAGGAGGGSSAYLWPSLISGGSDLLGVVLNNAMKEKSPRPGPIIANPAYQELMNRYLGIVDSYMQKHGIKPYVAASAAPTPGLPAPSPAVPPTATPMAAPPPPVVAPAPAAQSVNPSAMQDASLAASLGARRLGLKSDAPRLPTTRSQFEQSQGQSQQGLNDIYNFIYSQRNLGV